jgi:AcrR family transcriptional regulator
MPGTAARTLASHRHEMRGRVFDAFSQLLYERGYDALTLADIAKSAGMARTAIYNYFPDKETLLLAFTDHEMDSVFSELRIELYRVDDPIDRLRVYARSQLTYFATNHLPPGPALRAVLSAPGYAVMHRHAETLELILRGILAEAAADGRIPPGVVDDGQTVALINACLASGRVGDLAGEELDAAIVATEEFILRAVGAVPADGGLRDSKPNS